MMGTPRGNGRSGGGAALSGGEADSPRVVGQGVARGGVRGTRPLPAQDQGDPTLAVHYLPRRCLVIKQVGSQLLLHLLNLVFLSMKILDLPGVGPINENYSQMSKLDVLHRSLSSTGSEYCWLFGWDEKKQ